MVGVDHNETRQSLRNQTAAGACSGFLTRTVTQPFDVCKIRFQLQFEPIKKICGQSKYRGLAQAFKVIVQEEGLAALWKGTLTGQMLSVVYGAVEFRVFEQLSTLLWRQGIVKHPKDPFSYFICGGVAGVAATLAAHPLDLLRTRFVAQGAEKVYLHIHRSAMVIWRSDGLGGFYRGLWPALLQTAPSSGLIFSFYAVAQRLYRSFSGESLNNSSSKPMESLVCGAMAGAASRSVVHPLDVMKKRLQIQGFEEGRKGFGQFVRVDGFRSGIRTLYQLEGLAGFFKGFSPGLWKATTSTGFSFMFYEQCLRFLNFRFPDGVS